MFFAGWLGDVASHTDAWETCLKFDACWWRDSLPKLFGVKLLVVSSFGEGGSCVYSRAPLRKTRTWIEESQSVSNNSF